MIKLFNLLFPSIVGLNGVIDSVDAKIVTDEGWRVLNNPEKLKKLEENIKKNKFYM